MLMTVTRAVEILANGGIVAIPTETVYGLAAHALRPRSVARIFEAKQRPFFDPLIVHLADSSGLPMLVRDVPDAAEQLIRRFWPGPLTIVLKRRDVVPDLVTAGLPTVAIRVPAHPLARQILEKCGFPLAAPSANLFGRVSPTCVADVCAQLDGRIDGVVDGGNCPVGVESTIVDLSGDCPVLLRPGGVSREDIEACVGPVISPPPPGQNSGEPMIAPGTCARHYSPVTPFVSLVDAPWLKDRRIGLIAFGPQRGFRDGFAHVINLSESGNLQEAAARLYAALHEMDRRGLDFLAAEHLPEEGLGLAVNDRLRRAAAQER